MAFYCLMSALALLAAVGSLHGEIVFTTPPTGKIFYRAGAGETVMTVHAKADDGSKLKYILSGGDAEYFNIEPDSGLITTNRTILKNIGEAYLTAVLASTTNSTESQFKLMSMRIHVTIRNEHPPSFNQTRYHSIMYRGETPGKVVVVTQAFDGDFGVGDKLVYSIVPGNYSGYFQVNRNNGTVTLLRPFPPVVKQLAFSVRVKDFGSPQYEAEVDITVYIRDVSAPRRFCMKHTNSSSALLCWQRSLHGAVTNYRLDYWPSRYPYNRSHVLMDVGNENVKCYVLTGLSPWTWYNARVYAHNFEEFSPSSAILVFQVDNNVCNDTAAVCSGNGRCSTTYLEPGYTCTCDNGYFGKNCEHFDQCSLRPCANNGVCRNISDEVFECECANGYYGRTCARVNLCVTSNPCVSGVCRNTSNNFRCECSGGSYGPRCEHFNPCVLSNVCLNGGSCQNLSTYSYKCSCMNGYYGSNCGKFDPCSRTPCLNYGTCRNISDTNYTCSCAPAFFGQDCEYFNPCEIKPNPCLNDGVCSRKSNIDVTCACQPGFYGHRCDSVDVCRVESPCQNGASCRNVSSGRYHCDCAAGWSGTNCTYYDPCVEEPCLNDGLCLNRRNNQSVCICSGGHYGKYCEKYNPCAVKPCKNQGRCSNLTQTTYQCACREGFYGDDCERFNPCVRSRCDEHGTCRNLSDTDYMCECERGYQGANCSVYNSCILESPCQHGDCELIRSHEHMCRCYQGYFGSACQHYNPCVVVRCGNGGRCRNLTNDRYRCECPRGYYGDLCEYYNPCVEEPCQNAGLCRNVSSANYVCTCTAGYFGSNCQIEVDECSSHPCQNSGQCVDRVNAYTCHCRRGYSGPFCEIVAKCNQRIIKTKEGTFVWPQTKHGITVNVSCPYGAKNESVEGTAYATCSLGQYNDTAWSGIDVTRCKELNAVQAEFALKQLNRLTANPCNMTTDNVEEAATTLESLVEYAIQHRDVAVQMVSVLSSLMDADAKILRLSSANYSASERFRGVIDNYTANAVINNATDSIEIVSRNLRIKVLDKVIFMSGKEQDVQYQPAMNSTVRGKLTHVDTKADLQLTLPFEALRVSTPNETNSTQRIQFIAYQNSKFFVSKEKENVTASGDLENRTVLSASIKDRNITNLTKPVLIRFPVVDGDKVPKCVFWNESGKAWSSVGIVTNNKTDGGVLCEASHLTNFAILLDPAPNSGFGDGHNAALSYISYIGCGLSVLGLSLTLISFSLFPCLHREKSGKILINLCSSMLLMNISFLLGAHEGSAKNNGLCLAVAIFLHYFVLTTLLWMGVEAVHMYHVLIQIFGSYEERFLIKRCVVAWGIPVIVVGITVAVDVSNYKSKDEFCRLNYDNPYVYYISFLGPSCLILLVNAIIFIMLTRVILRPKLKSCKGKVCSSDEPKVTAAQVRGAITVMVLLGVTWIFGALAIGDAKLIFSYVFCIANSLQGFLIFIFRCFMYPEARMAWIQLCKQGTLKKRRGMPRSADTSSKGYDVKGHSRSSDEVSASHTFVTQTNLLNKSNMYKSRFKTRGNNSQKNLLSCSPRDKNVDPNMEYVTLEKLQENRSLINADTVAKAGGVRSSASAVTRPGELTRL